MPQIVKLSLLLLCMTSNNFNQSLRMHFILGIKHLVGQ